MSYQFIEKGIGNREQGTGNREQEFIVVGYLLLTTVRAGFAYDFSAKPTIYLLNPPLLITIYR
ncbi:hypothetical protein PCC6912_54540 [Chlorogloeopsis fritschii PCC 6912]|uniref:Uncharacterized protein n=1 Tax=Chlorogloeopsis fritschii PCC 6912 TaxID=211165 RepID=A0A3S0ZNA3_CHLFR|nr:hypothetical protein PCC6912_54540 [Chlorogloeopsis fritschii PCC 6912]